MKRKVFLSFIITLLICVPVFAGTVIYKLYPVSYPVYVDGVQYKGQLPALTYRANGGDNTYLPAKTVLNLMGARMTWTGKSANITTRQADPAKVANSVVMIYVSKPGTDWISQGSGVIVGYNQIITCSHVIDDGDIYKAVYNDGHTSKLRLIKDNPKADIALLEPDDKSVKPCKIGDSDEVKIGDSVFTVSSPNQKRNVIAHGEVLSKTPVWSMKGIVVSAKTDEGSSGGALFNKYGELIGIIDGGAIDKSDSMAGLINDVRKAIAN